MLNSTKTWEEEKINHTAEHIGIISRGVLETLVREVIAQTREETIREVGCCPKCFSKTKDWFNQQNKTGIHCSNCGWHEELNKLKK